MAFVVGLRPLERLFRAFACSWVLASCCVIAWVAGTSTTRAQALPLPLLEESFIQATDGADGDQFGLSVSIDGDRAVVGAFADEDNGLYSGAAYVFAFDGTSWIQEAKLLASDGEAFDYFGWSVAISGNRAVVGAWGDDSETGAAYVFAFDGVTWSEEQKLVAGDGGTFVDFGYSVAMDGNRAVMGAFGASSGGQTTGAAYVFSFDGVSWSEEVKLVATDGVAGDNLGISVSMEANRVVAGADGADVGGASSGAAYVFYFDGSGWQQESKLVAADGTQVDFFGIAVALSGRRVLVGAPQDDDRGTGSGSAYVFDFDGISWNQRVKLLAGDGLPQDHFGEAVAIDGNRLVVSAWAADDSGLESGKAYAFGFDGSTWIEQGTLLGTGVEEYDAFALSVSIEDDRVALGAPGDDLARGAAYFFVAENLHDFLILADSLLEIDRQADMAGDIHSNNRIELFNGNPSTLVGNVTAVGDIVIRQDQTVDGDVTAGGSLSIDPQATVTGTATGGAIVDPVPLPVLSFVAGGPKVRVNRGQVVSVPPGSYGDVQVKTGGAMVLFNDGTTGEYFMTEMDMKDRSFLFIDVSGGPVTINVVDKLRFGQDTQVMLIPADDAGALNVIFNVRDGDVDIKRRALVRGSIVAPNGEVKLERDASLIGTICAFEVVVDRGSGVFLPMTAALMRSAATTAATGGSALPTRRMR